MTVLYTLDEERPPAILGDVVALCVNFLRQSESRGDRR